MADPDYRFICHLCGITVVGIRPRPWPGVGILVDCPTCGNSQTVADPLADTLPPPSDDLPTDPDASTAASLLSDREPILSAERDTRGSERP